MYFNYKGSHSIVLLAVCDAQYKFVIQISSVLILFPLSRFILFDIGGAGRQSDGGTLSNSQFVRALESEILSIPDNLVQLTQVYHMLLWVMKLFLYEIICYVHIQEEIYQVIKNELLLL